MRPSDPLQILSVECVSIIFAYLSASDITRCKRVSKGWEVYVRKWIVTPGLRLHYQHEVNVPLDPDPMARERDFRRLSTLRKNMELGEASSMRKYEQVKAFTVAGKYCAWVQHGKGIFWQDLSPRKVGSLHPVFQLDRVDPLEEAQLAGNLMTLGTNGYLLVRYPMNPEPGRRLRDTLYRLSNQEQLWSHSSWWDTDNQYVPLCVGQHRVYFGTISNGNDPARMKAYELQSGKLLYEAKTIAHTNSFYGCVDTADYPFGHPLKLLDADQDEIILAFKPHRKHPEHMATIYLISGTDGTLQQSLKVELTGVPQIILSGNRTEFSVISHRHNNPIIRVEIFARLSDGQFAPRRLDIVDPQTTCRPQTLALDPFTHCIMYLVGTQDIPYCAKLVDSIDPNTLTSIKSRLRKPIFELRRVDRYLTPVDPGKITLPPSKAVCIRRRSLPSTGVGAKKIRLLDGHRIAIMCDEGDGLDIWTIYLFDFEPRVHDKVISG